MPLPIPPWPVGHGIPGLPKVWPLVTAPNLHSMFVGVCLELSRPSGSSGLAGRMPVPRVDVPPVPSHSGAESAPLAAPLMHLDLPASVLTVSLVAEVDRATLIHVHLSGLFSIPFVTPVILLEEALDSVQEILLLPSLWAAVVVYVVVRSLAAEADRTGSCLLC